MKDSLHLMLSLQDGVNSVIDPDWRERGNAWYRAVWMECAEILEREGDWKWWKAPPSLDSEALRQVHREQQQIELCDIWHFILSWALEDGVATDALCNWFDEPAPADSRHQVIESMVRAALADDLPALVRAFGAACAQFELSAERLFEMYVAKNVVNRFRQDRGYKDGSYRKVFGGKEDNEHLAEILAQIGEAAATDLPDRLYEQLAARYDAHSEPVG